MAPLDNNDRLSVLPDDVLLSLLERLDDTKSVVRAGVLSKRWKHLPWLLAELNINISAFKHDKSDLKGAMASFVQVAQSFLATSSSSERKVCTIKNLRMVFYLMSKDTIDILSVFTLLHNAMENWSPRHVELEIKAEMDRPSTAHASYFMSIGSSVFGSIKKLVLNKMRFDASELNLLLQNSKQLVNLEMHKCDCGEGMPFKIDAPESQIEHLKFVHCRFGRIKLFGLPKLQQLDCQKWTGTSVPLYLGSLLPSLKTLILRAIICVWMRNITLSEIGLANAPNLEVLVLGFFQENIWLQEEPVNQLQYSLSTLTSLTLSGVFVGCDLSWSMLLLEAAPILKRLVIAVRENYREGLVEYFGEKPKSISWKISSFKHHHLEKLMILGIKEDNEPWEFVKLIMAQAVRSVNVVFSDGYKGYDTMCQNDVVKTTHLELFDEDGKKRTIRVDRIC